VVHYFYHPNGQLASIGTADDPTRYAAYAYNLDGSITTEKLNKQRLQYDHSYDFQGYLLSLQESQGLFAENVRYRDTGGTFKDGNVVSTTFTGSALSNPHGYTYQYDAFGRLTAAQTVATNADMVPHPEWDLQDVAHDANGNLLHLRQGQASATYQYAPGTNRLTGLLHPSTDQRPFGFEPGELRSHFHVNSEPEIFGDWYAKGLGGGITTKEYHSGTQSYQLDAQHVLLSKMQVTPEAKGYLCSGWVKIGGPHQELGIQMKASLNGPVLAEQRVSFTDERWQFFQCQLPDAGTATELFVVILQTQLVQPPLPVSIDDITFGPLAQDVYEQNANGWLTKSGKIDEIHYDPQTALPVDIRSGEQHTHVRYGGRRQRVVKTTTANEPNAPREQRVYVHGANAYPLVEYTQKGRTCYIYGPGGLLAQSEDAQTFAFFLKDHLGSTRVVLNEENQPIATFRYLPFGSVIPDNSNSREALHRFRYLFTGQEYDEGTGLYNYRARLYDSDLRRFLTPDPKRQLPSPYVYVNNNPVNLIDPTGEMFRAFIQGTRRLRTVMGGRSDFMHSYRVRTPIGTVSDHLALDKVFDIMTSESRFITPQLFWEKPGAIIGTGDSTSIPILGSVAHTVDREKRTLTNIAQLDHMLYPGTVVHEIEQEGSTIFIHTKGTGYGVLPWVNEAFAEIVWSRPHGNLKEAIEKYIARIVSE
jgi:RHS repeat-associated protein